MQYPLQFFRPVVRLDECSSPASLLVLDGSQRPADAESAAVAATSIGPHDRAGDHS